MKNIIALLLLIATCGAAAAAPLRTERLTHADRVAWYKLLQWQPDTLEKAPGCAPEVGLQFWRYSTHRYLLEVEICRAAYQASYAYYWVDPTTQPPRATRIAFPGVDAKNRVVMGRPTDELVGLPYFDKRRRTLTLFSKSRGIGDIGSRSTWSLQSEKPRLLRVVRWEDEEHGRPPEQWPQVYPATGHKSKR
jgi:hypothetical protein